MPEKTHINLEAELRHMDSQQIRALVDNSVGEANKTKESA